MWKKASALAIGFSILLMLYGWHVSQQHERLAAELGDFVLPTTDLQEETLTQLRVYHYLLEARLEPIFALDGSEPDALTESVLLLYSHRKEIYSELSKQKDEKNLLDLVTPKESLLGIANSQKAREAFLINPTLENAIVYHRAMVRSEKAYSLQISNISEALTGTDKRKIAFWQGISSTAFIESQLNAAHEEAEKQLYEEQRRFACLVGNSSRCQPLGSILNNLAAQKIPNEQSPQHPALPGTIAHNLSILDTYIASEYGAGTNPPPYNESSGSEELPIISNSLALCGTTNETTYWRPWWHTAHSEGVPAVRMTELNDIYFVDLKKVDVSFEARLFEAGYPYLLQPTNPYVCVDLGYDTAYTLSAYYIQRKLIENPIFSNKSLIMDVSEITELALREESIRQSTDILTMEAVEQYVLRSEILLGTEGEQSLAEVLGPEAVLELEHIISVWRSKGAWLEYQIAHIDYLDEVAGILVSDGALTHDDALLTRTYPSTFYLLANETVVKTPLSLIQERATFNPLTFGLVSYNNTLRSLFSPTEIIKYIVNSEAAFKRIR